MKNSSGPGPGMGIIFTKIDLVIIPFSLVWFGMMLIVMFGASTLASENARWPVFLFLSLFIWKDVILLSDCFGLTNAAGQIRYTE